MKRLLVGLACLSLSASIWGQSMDTTTAPAAPTAEASPGPILYGDNSGRLWKWRDGVRTLLTAPALMLHLGGLHDGMLWGWTLQDGKSHFFTVKLPKKDTDPVPAPRLDPVIFPTPDQADWVGTRRLLVYSTDDGSVRWEVWNGTRQLAAQGYDDGRTVYAASLGPTEGWILAGRTEDNRPWLNVSGTEIPAPEGWEGRLSIGVWVPEKAAEDAGSDTPKSPGRTPAAPKVHPWAAGWADIPPALPQPIWWGPQGWQQPDEALPADSGGVYPLLGIAGKKGTPAFAGWAADAVTGTLRPWFWDGAKATWGEKDSDGHPAVLVGSAKGVGALVVRHDSDPWFTLEDGKTSTPLDGLQPDDRVVVAQSAKAGPSEPQTGP